MDPVEIAGALIEAEANEHQAASAAETAKQAAEAVVVMAHVQAAQVAQAAAETVAHVKSDVINLEDSQKWHSEKMTAMESSLQNLSTEVQNLSLSLVELKTKLENSTASPSPNLPNQSVQLPVSVEVPQNVVEDAPQEVVKVDEAAQKKKRRRFL